MGRISMTALKDSFGRIHRDLRISLTDRCNLRCAYCLPADFSQWLPHANQLTAAEIRDVVSVATELGITEVRLTGGEPLLRKDLTEIITHIAAVNVRPEISLTTNGIGLAKIAANLKDVGLDRINISLDTLNPETFKAITQRDHFEDVLAGISKVIEVGFQNIKINTVLMRGVNDNEVMNLIQWAGSLGVELRFIEQMPLDAKGVWSRSDMITAKEIFEVTEGLLTLTPISERGSAPAESFLVNSGPQKIGIIASVTQPFCGACDRLRLTSDGYLRSCLFASSEIDLRSALRDSSNQSAKEKIIREKLLMTVQSKAAGHTINSDQFIKPARPMSAIGG